MANKAAGKGYENTDFYENVKFQFVGIENIHVMRQSLLKMIEGKIIGCNVDLYENLNTASPVELTLELYLLIAKAILKPIKLVTRTLEEDFNQELPLNSLQTPHMMSMVYMLWFNFILGSNFISFVLFMVI